MTYPSTLSYNSSTQSFSTTPGPTYTYSFDSVHRYSGLTDQNNNQLASGVQYGPSSELLSINYSGMTETRQYNNLLQLTQLTNGMANLAYNYPAASNNGKISSLNNAITGETITYQYDSLERLMSAAGSGWSQGFGYDSFGNLTSITGSNAPALSVAVNAATNQIVGQGYDANGNQLSTGAFSGAPLTYDAENRLIHAPELQYAYDSRNKRIWKATLDSSNTYVTGQQVFFYGSNGQLLGTYALSTSTLGPSGQPYVLTDPSATPQVYFGAKRIDEIQDRLGSTIKSGSNGFFPYGEDRGTPQSGESFASYPSDSATSLSYADQRWYSSQFGRFMTADPSHSSATSPTNPRAPQSWNRYVYASGDPVNLVDPTGLDLPIDCGDDQCDGGGGDPGGGGGGCDWCGDGGGGGDGGGTPPCGPDGFLSAGCQAPPAPPPPPPPPPTVATPPPPPPPPPPRITIQQVDDCTYANGTSRTPGAFTLEVDYQVLVNGTAILGNYSLASAGISLVTENVTVTSGDPVRGGGNWCLSSATCDQPGSLTPAGTYWDDLAGNATVNQNFLINGQNIPVMFPGVGGAQTVLNNVYNSKGKTISVGSGALVGNSQTRACGKNGDPSVD